MSSFPCFFPLVSSVLTCFSLNIIKLWTPTSDFNMHVPTTALTALLAAGQLLSFVHAHVEMKNPIPFRSKFLVPNVPNTDFTNAAPINPDGSNFPCKGYHHD